MTNKLELPPIEDEDRQWLHYNPNTSDVVEWIQDYARRAIALCAQPSRGAPVFFLLTAPDGHEMLLRECNNAEWWRTTMNHKVEALCRCDAPALEIRTAAEALQFYADGLKDDGSVAKMALQAIGDRDAPAQIKFQTADEYLSERNGAASKDWINGFTACRNAAIKAVQAAPALPDKANSVHVAGSYIEPESSLTADERSRLCGGTYGPIKGKP